MTPEQERAYRYYNDIARDYKGELKPMLVDEYGPGIPHHLWETMKESGWFKYSHGIYGYGDYQTWDITDEGRAVFALPTDGEGK